MIALQQEKKQPERSAGSPSAAKASRPARRNKPSRPAWLVTGDCSRSRPEIKRVDTPSARQRVGKAGGRGGSFSGTLSRQAPRYSHPLASTPLWCADVSTTRMALRPTHPNHQPIVKDGRSAVFSGCFLRAQLRHVRSMAGVAGRRSIRVVRRWHTRAVLTPAPESTRVSAASVTGEWPPLPSASAHAQARDLNKPLSSTDTRYAAARASSGGFISTWRANRAQPSSTSACSAAMPSAFRCW
jgi:hypothetical protein